MLLNNGRYFSEWKGKAWFGMNRRTKEAPHYSDIKIVITRDEFQKFCDDRFDLINSMKKPSIDRIKPELHYSIDNIQIIECYENTQKPNIEKRIKIKAVHKTNGQMLKFESLLDASKNGFNLGHVSSCLSGKRRSHKNFLWSYDDYARGDTDDSKRKETIP